jgi:hypothetical protein
MEKMDQNMEPKVDTPEPKIKRKRVKPEDIGYYFLGATSPKTFVGYIKGGMTEAEIQEYIDFQERLAPPSRQKENREPQPELQEPAKDNSADAERPVFPARQPLTTIYEADEEGIEEDAPGDIDPTAKK